MAQNNTALVGFNFKFSLNNSNRALAVFVASLLLIALIPALTLPAMAADNVTYLDEFGSTISVSAEVIDGVGAMPSTLTDGWYILKDGFTCTDRVVVDGDVCLILGDGCDVVVDGGIEVNVGNSLTIYAQSLDENVMGKLTATAKSYSYDAGIGGSSGVDCGSVTICGGIVDATGFSGGAGIGGGGINRCDGGVITISGGKVTAKSTANGAGIGGGAGGDGGVITISGGKVTATSGDHGAGIGGGTDGNCGTIVICGDADVTATGGSGSAGIGGGQDDYAYSDHTAGGTITISGGKVTATGGIHGAGIGGGSEGDGGTIVICGDADVTATGGFGSAGIGGGHYGDSGNVFVYGENVVVSATGGEGAMDIGVGRQPVSRVGNVFVLLPSSQLTTLDAAQNVVPSGNTVTFSASHLTADDVTVVLPSPFNAAPFVDANPLVVTTGLGPVADGKAKDFSIITTFTAVDEIVFSLVGYVADPPVSTGQSLQVFGAEVKFVKLDVAGEVVHIYPDAASLTVPLADYNLPVGKVSDLSVLYDSAYKVSEVRVEKYGTITYSQDQGQQALVIVKTC